MCVISINFLRMQKLSAILEGKKGGIAATKYFWVYPVLVLELRHYECGIIYQLQCPKIE